MKMTFSEDGALSFKMQCRILANGYCIGPVFPITRKYRSSPHRVEIEMTSFAITLNLRNFSLWLLKDNSSIGRTQLRVTLNINPWLPPSHTGVPILEDLRDSLGHLLVLSGPVLMWPVTMTMT